MKVPNDSETLKKAIVTQKWKKIKIKIHKCSLPLPPAFVLLCEVVVFQELGMFGIIGV